MAKQKAVTMSVEDMKRAIAASEAASKDSMFQAAESAEFVGSSFNAASPAVAAGVSSLGDLESLWASPQVKAAVADTVATALKFSIVGSRSKAVNVYFANSPAGVAGLRSILMIIKSLGLKFEAVEKTVMTKWENGKALEVPCDPYKFLKLSASSNGLTGARLLFKLCEQVQAAGVDWS